jgi:tetratricopeptide (TPR) repeat protein
MKKKAQGEVGAVLWNLLGTILVVVIIISVGIFLGRAITAGSGNPLAATEQTLGSISSSINKLLADNQLHSYTEIPGFVGEKHVIVGFNKGKELPIDGCFDRDPISRPDDCGEFACLCIYKNNDGEFGGQKWNEITPHACQTFPQVDKILSLWMYYQGDESNNELSAAISYDELKEYDPAAHSNFRGTCYYNINDKYESLLPRHRSPFNKPVLCGKSSFQPTQYSSLVVYGECDNQPHRGSDDELNDQDFTIEKVIIDGETIILVAPAIKEDIMRTRISELQKSSVLSILNAADLAFEAGNYEKALELYLLFLENTKDAEKEYGYQIKDAKFKISETYYANSDFENAANAALKFMSEYSIFDYTHRSEDLLFSQVPITKYFQLRIEDSPDLEKVKKFRDRLEKLLTGAPTDPTLIFLLGQTHYHLETDDFLVSIELFNDALQRIKGEEPIDEISIHFNLAEAHRFRMDRLRAAGEIPTSEEFLLMLDSYQNVLDAYDWDANYLSFYNKAHNTLVEQCGVWIENLDTVPEVCKAYPEITSENKLGLIFENQECKINPDWSFCGVNLVKILVMNMFLRVRRASGSELKRVFRAIFAKILLLLMVHYKVIVFRMVQVE